MGQREYREHDREENSVRRRLIGRGFAKSISRWEKRRPGHRNLVGSF